MVRLVHPHVRHHATFLEAVAEYEHALESATHCEPREAEYLESRFYDGDHNWLVDPANFAVFVDRKIADSTTEFPRPEGWVPATHLWLVDEDDTYLGALDIRHAMTPFLLDQGGIIGYDIRPSARGRGLGRRQLRLALPAAHQLGFDPVLITCDDTNRASARVIEANGGELEDVRGVKRRYWVPTTSSSSVD